MMYDEECEYLVNKAINDIYNDDYVVLERIIGFVIVEKILTFSNIYLKRMKPYYACYATSERGSEDSQESLEES